MKLLVIDGESAVFELMSSRLQSSNDIIISGSGADGIRLARTMDPDIIILDVLSDSDGCRICRKIRMFSSVPILILLLSDNPGMVARSLDAGADDCMVKPVTSGVLFSRVGKLLRRSNTSAGFHLQRSESYYQTR